MNRLRTLIGTILAGITLNAALVFSAHAQTFPNKPIRFVVPFSAGSATDTLARLLGQYAAEKNGWTVIVENIVGANGVIAASNVARAAPDGYTVMITTNTTHAANQSLMKSLPYNAVDDFEHLTQLGTIALTLVVSNSVPAKTVPELVSLAKQKPGELTYGSGASSARVAAEMFNLLAGTELRMVGYRSNPQAIQDLIGGHISMVFADLSTALPQVRAGTIKGLAVTTKERTPLAMDLPTLDEMGVKGYDLSAWFGAFMPAKTPTEITEKIRAVLVEALKDEPLRQKIIAAGIEPKSSTSADLKAFVISETKKWADIVKAAKIEPN